MFKNFKPHGLTTYLLSNFKINPLKSCQIYQFSRTKNKSILRTSKISIKKLNAQYNGFVLYENDQSAKIKLITFLFLFGFVSGLFIYKKVDSDLIKMNYKIIGILLIIPFAIYQIRLSKTLKRLILDKQGENIIITKYNIGGFTQESTKAKVQILRGITKGTIFGGTVIRGGGVYGFEQKKYWFQSKFIKQRIIFQEIVQGNRVLIDKNKIYE